MARYPLVLRCVLGSTLMVAGACSRAPVAETPPSMGDTAAPKAPTANGTTAPTTTGASPATRTPTPTSAATAIAAKASADVVSITLVAPEELTLAPRLEATGNLKPQQSAPLAFAVPGTLERVFVKRAQAVAADAVLATLDAAAAKASLAQTEAGVAAAEAQLRLAEDALARLEAIRGGEGGVSEAQVLQAQAQRDLALAQVLAARAQRDQAQVLFRHHTLRAPFAGVVIRVPDGIGVAVSPALPLFVLEATRTLVLETSVTQEEAAELHLGTTVQVTIPATGEHTPAPNAEGSDAQARQARIDVIVPSVDVATNRVPIEISVPNPDGRFRAHAFAKVEIAGGQRRACACRLAP